MAKKYWLGPGVYFVGENKPDIQTDEIIPVKVLTQMGAERVKTFENAGRIGLAPKSSVHIIAAKNTQKALKVSEKEKSKALNEAQDAVQKAQKLEAENKYLKAQLKEFKDVAKKLEAKSKSLEKLGAAYKKLKTDCAELQKQLKENKNA